MNQNAKTLWVETLELWKRKEGNFYLKICWLQEKDIEYTCNALFLTFLLFVHYLKLGRETWTHDFNFISHFDVKIIRRNQLSCIVKFNKNF